MKFSNILKRAAIWLVLVLELSIVQPVRGQNWNQTGHNSLFEYAIFYNGLLEFSDTATLTVTGRFHSNTNIYVGSPSALTFNSLVTTAGTISSPPNAGYSAATWTGPVTYNGTPTPGYITGQPAVILPFGNNSVSSSNAIQLIYPPTASQRASTVAQLYYTQAHLTLWISNNMFYATFKSSPIDPNPVTLYTNLSMLANKSWLTNTLDNTISNRWATNWGQYWGWLSTTNTFYDFRETSQAVLSQIDVGKLGLWITNWLGASWNTNIAAKFSANNPFNIIWVGDWRYTNSTVSGAMNFSAIRLTNGASLPPNGLTVATPNPLYIEGIYNCPNPAFQATTNTTASVPSSVACDALTLLSPNWNDANARNSTSAKMPAATNDTVNTAIIAGNVPSTGTASTNYSGGLNNLPRLLENWSGGATLTLNTSLICLYGSIWANRQFQLPGVYYFAPTRQFSFDQGFLYYDHLPPATPFLTPTGTNVAAASVSLGNLAQTYSGAPLVPTVLTYPPGLSVSLGYSSGNNNTYSSNAVGAGIYLVAATVNGPFYSGATSNYFYINKAPATVTLSNLSQTYDGTAKSVLAATSPPGLAMTVTYNGLASAPTNAGSYSVAATITDGNYQGSETNTLVIAPAAAAPVALGGSMVMADGTFQLNFTNTPGASFSVLGSADPFLPLTNWTVLGGAIEISPGEFEFTDAQATNMPRRFYILRSP